MPGAGGTEGSFVHVNPPSRECHSAALPCTSPEKAEMTISSGFWGLIAMLVSPSLNRSVNSRVTFVLLTTVSTIGTSRNCGGIAPESAAPRPSRVASSGTAPRAYGGHIGRRTTDGLWIIGTGGRRRPSEQK